MKTLQFKGMKFAFHQHDFAIKRQTEDVDSWLYKVMTHYELNGIVEKFDNKTIKTQYQFIKSEDGYVSKELNGMYDIFGFKLKIINEDMNGKVFTVKLFKISTFFIVSFVTLDEAIKFCQILINYETMEILQRNEGLYQ